MKMKNMFSKVSSDNNGSVTSATSSSSSSHKNSSGHTFSQTIMEEDIENAEEIIRKWDLDAHFSTDVYYSSVPLLFNHENRKEAQKFLNSVVDLRTAMRVFVSEDAASPTLLRAHNLMQIAMKRLEKEFYTILKAHRTTILSPESVSQRSSHRHRQSSRFSDEEESTSDESSERRFEFGSMKSALTESASESSVMENLKSIADCMISSGHGKECVHIYKIIRTSMIDEAFYYLGVDKSGYTQSQFQKMGWDVLEVKIKKWLATVRTAVKTLFHGERVLCDYVFSSAEHIREACFAEISRDNALALFSFPENVAKSKKIFSPEKMFRFLDMYEAISELWVDMATIFSSDSLSAVRSQAMVSLLKIGEAVRVMLSQFESAIQKDSSKTAVPGGGIHPLTRYVMNYLVFLSDYSGSVADIVADWPLPAHTPLPASYFSSPVSVNGGGAEEHSLEKALPGRLAWIILVLLCKLDGKAGVYKDHVALSYLFLANNLNYVVSKVKTSNLILLMGPDWLSSHESKVKQYSENHQRMGWAKTLASLPDDPTADIPLPKITECFRQLNAGFEEAYRVQSSWVIPDPKLRDEVKFSIFRKLVPVYRTFYEKHRKAAAVRDGSSVVRYAPEDLENYLSDLFFGNTVSGGGSSSGSGNSKATSREDSPRWASPSRHGAVNSSFH